MPQVIDKQNQTNTFVTDAQTNIAGLGAQVNAVTGVVNTQTQVSQTAGLPGATNCRSCPITGHQAGGSIDAYDQR